jgi:hypothetical protein
MASPLYSRAVAGATIDKSFFLLICTRKFLKLDDFEAA